MSSRVFHSVRLFLKAESFVVDTRVDHKNEAIRNCKICKHYEI